MKHVTLIARGSMGKTWLIEIDGTIWLYDPNNEKGMNGELVIFRFAAVGGPAYIETRGPWASSKEALKKDTGIIV